MHRTLLALSLLLGCVPPSPGAVQVSIVTTPASLTRPCLARFVLVYDDLGNEYQAPQDACNEALLTLPEGRTFAGAEVHVLDLEQASIYLVPQ